MENASTDLDPDRCYRALASRDSRFDGRFFVGVRTTGVYCRPVCPAPRPKARNVDFYPCAAAAEEAGFRPCRRCRPETAPGTPAWCGTSATVTRALRLIGDGAMESGGVEDLATRLGVGARHLRRLFTDHLGASPLAVARTRRVHFARRLIDETALPMTEIAHASGFSSVRQFNHAILACFGRPPRELRRAAHRKLRPTPKSPDDSAASLHLRLPYRPPFDWDALLEFLAARAVPGVEVVANGAYRRSTRIDGAPWIEVTHAPDMRSLMLRVDATSSIGLQHVVERVRRVFDLCADPGRIEADLGDDPELSRRVRSRPGLRVPGAFDLFELAVRAVLGQQVTVKGATTLVGRLVARFGTRLPDGPEGITHIFPEPGILLGQDLSVIGLPASRARTLENVAALADDGGLEALRSQSLEAAVDTLCGIPGVGPWTAHYVAMRALGEPDAFPASDLGLRRALVSNGAPLPERELFRRSEAWRPWRAYAAMWLWQTPPRPVRSEAL
jgi:AraC family transcriptional regulator of adaptative response / DNA-3-methyladenine glycosylase II